MTSKLRDGRAARLHRRAAHARDCVPLRRSHELRRTSPLRERVQSPSSQPASGALSDADRFLVLRAATRMRTAIASLISGRTRSSNGSCRSSLPDQTRGRRSANRGFAMLACRTPTRLNPSARSRIGLGKVVAHRPWRSAIRRCRWSPAPARSRSSAPYSAAIGIEHGDRAAGAVLSVLGRARAGGSLACDLIGGSLRCEFGERGSGGGSSMRDSQPVGEREPERRATHCVQRDHGERPDLTTRSLGRALESPEPAAAAAHRPRPGTACPARSRARRCRARPRPGCAPAARRRRSARRTRSSRCRA